MGFALRVPSSWFELDLVPSTRNASINSLVEERLKGVPEMLPHRATIVRLLRGAARDAWASGARYCACLVDPTDEGPVSASVTVSVVTGPLGVRPGDPAYAEALRAPLHPKLATSAEDTWRDVAAVDVPGATRGVRAWGVVDVEIPEDAGWVRVVQMLQFAPVPDANRVVLVTCTSPVLSLTEALLDVFDAICGTLRLVRAEQSTAAGL
jgi:hypothetical protein